MFESEHADWIRQGRAFVNTVMTFGFYKKGVLFIGSAIICQEEGFSGVCHYFLVIICLG